MISTPPHVSATESRVSFEARGVVVRCLHTLLLQVVEGDEAACALLDRFADAGTDRARRLVVEELVELLDTRVDLFRDQGADFGRALMEAAGVREVLDVPGQVAA